MDFSLDPVPRRDKQQIPASRKLPEQLTRDVSASIEIINKTLIRKKDTTRNIRDFLTSSLRVKQSFRDFTEHCQDCTSSLYKKTNIYMTTFSASFVNQLISES